MSKFKLLLLYLFYCFLELLFKCKPLYKTFIRLVYFYNYHKRIKEIILTNDRTEIVLIQNEFTIICAFFKIGYSNFEHTKY